MQLHPLLTEQDAKVKQPCHVHAKQKEQQTTDFFHPLQAFTQMRLELIGGNSGNRPEQDEDDGKPDDKTDRVQQNRHADLGRRMSIVKLLE